MQAKPWKHITKMHESVYYPVRVQATVALALAGALFVSQILQEQGAFSVPRPADRQGALKAPNRESGTELWSQLKTPNAGKQEGKVGGEKGGCSCSFSADFVFSAWVFFFFPPVWFWRTFGSSLSVTLSICIWISENREQRHVVFFWWRSGKKLSKNDLREQSCERLISSKAVVCLEAEKTEYKKRGEMWCNVHGSISMVTIFPPVKSPLPLS